MGSSPDASIAWGIPLDAEEDDGFGYSDEACEAADAYRDRLEELTEADLDDILGWTEPFPGWPEHLRGLPLDQRDTEEYRAQEAAVSAWRERHLKGVPLDFGCWGNATGNGETGRVLLLRRSETRVDYSYGSVDPATLAPPDEAELAAFRAVLDHLEFTGDRTPRLLLFAGYG